jgi:hypothetical protein
MLRLLVELEAAVEPLESFRPTESSFRTWVGREQVKLWLNNGMLSQKTLKAKENLDFHCWSKSTQPKKELMLSGRLSPVQNLVVKSRLKALMAHCT